MAKSKRRRDPAEQPRPQVKPVVWVAGVLGVLALSLAAVAIPLNAAVFGMSLALAFPLGIAHAGSIGIALFFPRSATAISCSAVFLLAMAARSDDPTAIWPVSVTTLIGQGLLISVLGAHQAWPTGLWCWLGGVAAAAGGVVLAPRNVPTDAVAGNLVLFGAVTGGALGGALVVRQWRQISSQLVQERRLSADEHAKRVVAEEKTRIARELHDVIAHSMSLINVQATTAQYRHPCLDPRLAAEFDEMAAASRRALREMRGVLGVLRDGQTGGELVPQPSLARIPELIDSASRAGVDVSAHGTELLEDRTDSEIAGIAAFRIVQEALSNVTRHAPGTRTEVRFGRSSGELTITVRNTAPDRVVNPVPSGGHGLVGMQERVAIVNGSVHFGHTGDGGYEVCAVLPLNHTDNDSQEREIQ
ncbi:histidine kinase [Saccharopolyspora sp. K220]|uniref:sensor histidine kinase n=1 Tax=Saccharopolyspora soli TaxID=2926618 RepID=UPI001F5878A1|nr:histidine kinase [Saccharopolyspora soli]MCI2419356.1 histidine kinase [Saccharopolyspora soli]